MSDSKLVRVFHANKTGGSLVHGPLLENGKQLLKADGTNLEYRLQPGGFCDVPADVADLWLSHTNYGAPVCTVLPADTAPIQNKIAEQRDALAGENQSLKDRLAAMEKLIADLKGANAPTLPVTPEPQAVVSTSTPKTKSAK